GCAGSSYPPVGRRVTRRRARGSPELFGHGGDAPSEAWRAARKGRYDAGCYWRVKAFLYLLGSNLFWGGRNYSWLRKDSGSRGVTAIRSVVGSYVVFEATVYSKYLLEVHLLASSKAAGMSCSNEVEGQAEWRCLASLATAKRALTSRERKACCSLAV
uniref:Uncharacterized protein n=1 Tax=Gasterosteus aculeatus TaxID=69293 RepID=G3Q546_GASAC